MPKEKFDFDEFAALKFDKYKKAYCKPVQLKKATAAIVLIDYMQNKKKVAMNIIPYKKYVEAMDLFKQIKADKVHKMPKVALVLMNVEKEDVSFEVRKGGLSGEILDKRATKFFADIKLNYLGSTNVEEEEAIENEVSDVSEGEEAEGPVDARRAASYDKMEQGISQMKNSIGKVDAAKLEANLEKYRAALDKLEEEAMADGKITKDERKQINQVKKGIRETEDALNKAMSTKSKKLTPERRQKINGNMQAMQTRLDKMMQALGIA